MSTTITGKLQRAANEFKAGENIGFGFKLGVRYYDFQEKKNNYTNYDIVIFCKEGNQAQFYRDSLIEDSIVEVTAESERIKKDEYRGKEYISIALNNAKIGYINSPQGQQSQQAPKQSTQQQKPSDFDNEFDSDLPF